MCGLNTLYFANIHLENLFTNANFGQCVVAQLLPYPLIIGHKLIAKTWFEIKTDMISLNVCHIAYRIKRSRFLVRVHHESNFTPEVCPHFWYN